MLEKAKCIRVSGVLPVVAVSIKQVNTAGGISVNRTYNQRNIIYAIMIIMRNGFTLNSIDIVLHCMIFFFILLPMLLQTHVA